MATTSRFKIAAAVTLAPFAVVAAWVLVCFLTGCTEQRDFHREVAQDAKIDATGYHGSSVPYDSGAGKKP
jgi:hypothetical protein